MAGRGTVIAGVAALVTGWVAAPVVSMARRGTLDQQTVEAWRREGRASGRPREDTAVRIPAPRRAAEHGQRVRVR